MNTASFYGECRCCFAVGEHRDVMKEYYNDGSREVYFDMFLECFNVFLSTPTGANLICERCVGRLRDANAFRMMVVNAEKDLQAAFQRYQVPDNNPPDIKYELVTDVKVEGPKDFTEAEAYNEDLVPHTPAVESEDENLPLSSLAHNNATDCSMTLECDFCLKEFDSKDQLTSHIAEHSVDNDERTEGNGPNKSSASSEIQKPSQKGVEGARKDYVCKYCDKQYKVAYALRKHVENHTGRRPYVCKFCGQRFSYYDTFTRHKGQHTDLPHSCTECKKQFATQYELNRHGLVHTKEKPYLCDNCGKGFTQKDYLVDHLDMHAGVKAYCCIGCKTKFTHGYQYTWHKKKCRPYRKKKRDLEISDDSDW